MIYEIMYEKLNTLIPSLDTIPSYQKIEIPGMLNLDMMVWHQSDKYTRISLDQYYDHGGYITRNQRIEIRFSTTYKMAQVVRYEDMQCYYECNPGTGELEMHDPVIKKRWNAFFSQCLSDLLDQGYQF